MYMFGVLFHWLWFRGIRREKERERERERDSQTTN
jgi:hypothetical protein